MTAQPLYRTPYDCYHPSCKRSRLKTHCLGKLCS